jgi:hypothetical protein
MNPPGKDKHGNPTGLPTQMSHMWIAYTIEDENLTLSGLELKEKLINMDPFNLDDESVHYPYKRWISIITGRQLNIHRKSKGATHDVQIVLDLPDEILYK